MKIRQAFSEQPHLVSELVDYLYSGRGKEMLDKIKLANLFYEDNGKKKQITALASYTESNFDGLYDSRSFKDRTETKRVLIFSFGAMEKNIDVVIRHGFKRRGMRRTKEKANHLRKLIILRHNKKDWEEF